MSQSHLEQLLSQLELTKPSTALDDRVTELIGTPASHLPQTHLRGWSRTVAFTGIVAATLLIGSAAGYLVRDLTQKVHGGDTMSSSRNPSTEKISGISNQQVSNVHVTPAFQGPTVGITCSLVSLQNPSSTLRTECQDCHSGQDDAEQRFLAKHATMSHFATCTLCHTSDVSL